MSNLLNIKDENGNWIPIPIATNGIASIIQNSDYTLTITLEDGTVYTTTSIRGEQGVQGIKGDKGDSFTYSDFTPEQLASLKGEKGDKGDQGIQGIQGEQGIQGIQGIKGDTGDKGDKGDAFTYSDFTPEQLASLKGEKGDKGDAFEYSDFTPQQLASLKGDKGDKGDAFTYADFTPEQLASLKGERGEQGIQGVQGEKGDAFTYADFTPEQLASLKGEKGDKGDQGIQGIKGDTGDKGDKGDAFTYSDFTPEQLASLKGEKGDTVIVDSVPTQGSTNAVSSGGVYSALAEKQNTLVFDSTPTENSTNPVTSGGVYSAIENSGGGETTEELDKLAPVIKSKNLYDATACNPQNGYWYHMNTGVLVESANYAVSGKIPVDPNTEYIFSTNGIAKEKHVICFGGENGETFLKRFTTDNASFTTEPNTTFIGVNLFAMAHTTEQYESAIAVAQLEKGSVATDYVPYSETRKIPTSSLIDEDAVEGAINYTEKCSLINLYDKSLAVDGRYFNTSSHTFISGNANKGNTGFIPVKPNTQYNISCDKTLPIGELASYYQEWTADKTFIQHTQQPVALRHIGQIQTTENTAYITMDFNFGQAHTTEQFNALIDTVMLVEGMMRPLEYSPYNNEPVVNHAKIDIMRQLNADKFRGKKWLVTGTSVSYQDSKVYTEGVAEGELVRGYIGNVSRCKPMLIRNEGISGSTLADTTQDTALINRYQNLNMGSYDFITVEYGINDFGRNVPVGTENDSAGTSTFAACLKTIIEYALAQNPIVGLIICTEPDVRGTTVNQNGNTLKDYADVTLAIAKQYRLPVCDWFYHSGINHLTRGDGSSRYYFTQAGTHPSVYGHMRMGAMLNQVFDSLLC